MSSLSLPVKKTEDKAETWPAKGETFQELN